MPRSASPSAETPARCPARRPVRPWVRGCPWRLGSSLTPQRGQLDTGRARAARPRPPARSPTPPARSRWPARSPPNSVRSVTLFQRAGEQIDHQRIAEIEARGGAREEVRHQHPDTRPPNGSAGSVLIGRAGCEHRPSRPLTARRCAATSGRCGLPWSRCSRSISTASGAEHDSPRQRRRRGSPGGDQVARSGASPRCRGSASASAMETSRDRTNRPSPSRSSAVD